METEIDLSVFHGKEYPLQPTVIGTESEDDMTAIVLENSLLKAGFDPETGALIGLESKRTGWLIQNRPYGSADRTYSVHVL